MTGVMSEPSGRRSILHGLSHAQGSHTESGVLHSDDDDETVANDGLKI